jgi:uncharacterized protein YkwD
MLYTYPAICFAHNHSGVTADEVLYYVNEFREHHGLRPLKLNNSIIHEAEKHSIKMAEKNIPFGHAGFNNRAKRLMTELSANSMAENVAYGNISARKVVDLWIHSPGHRKNMLGNYNLTGIGIASDRHGELYFTQIFINKK